MVAMGLAPAKAQLAERLWFVPGWDSLTGIAQVMAARKMEIYAAMVEYLDDQVGRLLEHLERCGELQNTVVLFLSDNGPESSDIVTHAKERPAWAGGNFIAQNYRADFPSWGRHDAYLAYGIPWAQVSASPLSMFKGSMYEGGIRSPLIVWPARGAPAGAIDTTSILHVADIAPTLLELAGAPTSKLFDGASSDAQLGRSLASLLTSGAEKDVLAERGLGMEMWGCRAWREGRYKAVWMHRPFGVDDWQLFDLAEDPGELHDLGEREPERLERMIAAWERYAAANNVVLPDRTEYDGQEETLPPRPPVNAPGWPRGQELNWTSRKRE